MPACRPVHLSRARNVPACRAVVYTADGGMFALRVSPRGYNCSGPREPALGGCKGHQFPRAGEVAGSLAGCGGVSGRWHLFGLGLTGCIRRGFLGDSSLCPCRLPNRPLSVSRPAYSRSGSRTGVLSGRSARRPPTSSARQARCCPRRACLSSRRPPPPPPPPWATACALSTPTTPAGRPPPCRACRSCRCRRRWAGSKPWRSRCPSAAWRQGRRPTPWACPTAWRAPTARGCSRTSTSPPSPAWCPPPSPAPATSLARRSSAAPRTAATCGGARASPPSAARH